MSTYSDWESFVKATLQTVFCDRSFARSSAHSLLGSSAAMRKLVSSSTRPEPQEALTTMMRCVGIYNQCAPHVRSAWRFQRKQMIETVCEEVGRSPDLGQQPRSFLRSRFSLVNSASMRELDNLAIWLSMIFVPDFDEISEASQEAALKLCNEAAGELSLFMLSLSLPPPNVSEAFITNPNYKNA